MGGGAVQAMETSRPGYVGGRLDLAMDVAGVVLRLITGVVMAYHGWAKFDSGVSGFGQFLDSLGIPFPGFMGYVVALLELSGGTLLIIGLLTRLWALLFAIEMVFTSALVKLEVGLIGDQGAGLELDLMIFAAAVTLLFLGPGRLSADRAMGIEPLERHLRRS
jgi:putative oxidoreductase